MKANLQMNLTGRQITPKPERAKPNPAYLAKVRALPCCACRKPAPSEAHHCRDLPDYDQRNLYDRIPVASLKSSDRDAIPLCADCHRMFHLNRGRFHLLYGRDYDSIASTRRKVDST